MTNSTFINTRLLVTFIFFYKKITRVSSLHSKLQHLLRSITRVPLALRAIGAFCYAKCTRVSNLHSKLRCVAKIHFCVHFAVQNVYKCIFTSGQCFISKNLLSFFQRRKNNNKFSSRRNKYKI